MNMVQYDASVIITFATNLYEQAERVVVSYTVGGVVIGGAIGMALGASFQNMGVGGFIGASLAGVIAFLIGQQKAFALRLQAQIALCQVQIEANTRLRL